MGQALGIEEKVEKYRALSSRDSEFRRAYGPHNTVNHQTDTMEIQALQIRAGMRLTTLT